MFDGLVKSQKYFLLPHYIVFLWVSRINMLYKFEFARTFYEVVMFEMDVFCNSMIFYRFSFLVVKIYE